MENDTEKTKKLSVPKAMQERYHQLVAHTDAFCVQHLNDDYADLARKAIAALCRKRPSPVTGGRADIWACAVVYALGSVNFLSDKTQTPYMTFKDLCCHFGVSSSTAASKARQIQDWLKMSQLDYHWMLPDRIEDFAPVWLVSLNGLMVDIRNMPRPIQEQAFQQKIIPYIPDDRKPQHPRQAERDRVLDVYDEMRRINIAFHTEMIAPLLAENVIQPVARRLHLMDEDGAVFVDNDEDVIKTLSPAFDVVIYGPPVEGKSMIDRYIKAQRSRLDTMQIVVLNAMRKARFSIYKVLGKHEVAGVWLDDTISGEKIWLIDRGLEASAKEGMLLGFRLFKVTDFWMSTGVFVPVGAAIKKGSTRDRNKLAEEMYREYYGNAG